MKDISIIHMSYFAGIIDGEGCIYIGRFRRNKKTNALQYQTRIEVTNTSEILIDWLVKHIGGSKYAYSENQTPKNSRKRVFRWVVSGDLLTELCYAMYPYLVIKKNECDVMLNIRKTFEKHQTKKGIQGTQPIDEETMKLREKYFHELQALHCRNLKNNK